MTERSEVQGAERSEAQGAQSPYATKWRCGHWGARRVHQ